VQYTYRVRPMSRLRAGLLVGCLVVWSCYDSKPAFNRVNTNGDTNSALLHTSICEVASNPAAFYDKNIVVYGCVATDGVERTG